MIRISDINEIVQSASMVVGGYAFSKMDDRNIRIVGLEYPNHALVIRPDGEILETNMDDIELEIVLGYWVRNQKYMEEEVDA